MRTRNISASFAAHFSRRRISRVLAVVLSVTLLQVTAGIESPVSYAVAGNVGSTTSSGSCSSAVGEQDYVTASFNSTLGFCLIKFNSGTTWTVPSGVIAIDVLVVGGGGGGGSDGGGGGGGGEVRLATGIAVTANNSATITVGAGGIGNIHGQSNGTNGGASSIVVNGTTVTANGGLKSVNWQSAEYYAPGGSGGSGGTQVTGATNYSKGGRNSIQTAGYLTGFGTVGYDGVSTTFTGPSTVFAGGGGGGICTNTKSDPNFGGLAGGAGGGGRGALHTKDQGSDAGQPGTDGLGGGGGGGSACNDGGTDLVNARTAGGSGGKGVVYVKYVPYIFLATDPQPVTVAIGGTATFTSVPFAAITGPTRTKKWQVLTPGGSWTDIAGATGSDSYSTPTVTRAMQKNQYRYVVTDTLGTASSSTASVGAILTVAAPAQGDSDTALTISSTSLGNTTVAGGESIKPISSDSFTAEAWYKPTDSCTGAYCNLLGREGDWLLAFNSGELTYNTYNSNTWTGWTSTGVNIPLNQWSHVALTKSSGIKWTLYVNGTKVYSIDKNYSPQTSSTYSFYVGNRIGGLYPIKGSIDEVKLWKTDRGSSITSDMNSTTTSAGALVAYWNFNEASLSTAYNQAVGAADGTDLSLSASNLWDADVISTEAPSGSYTVRTFKRSYLTLSGGWKSPTGITKVTTVLVAGGGGGGGGLNGGGGGAGGFIETTTSITPATYYPITVGAGGIGFIGRGGASDLLSLPNTTNGSNSVVLGLTAIGGGYGASEYASPNDHYPANSGGSGGGGSWGNNSANYAGKSGTSGQGNKGGDSGSISDTYAGAGGGGAGAAGGNPTTTVGGTGGAGKLSVVLNQTLAGGGGGGRRNGSNAIGTGGSGGAGGGGSAASANATPNTSNGAQSGSANTGGGGGGGVRQTDGTDGKGAQGGTGVVAIRWITSAKPSFTPPTNAYLNVGMTETFTTNVAVDSATVDLTRTFRWESSTSGANGTFSLIKQGTGAANAAFAWVPTNASTSGSNYVYRVIVTDSDTAGLFIVDTSTPVYAVINQALVVTGTSTIPKAINVTKSETFTITLGTSTYRPTLSPIISGISLDTSTPGYAVVKISDTMTVGTYYETLTVVDSVSASVTVPLIIKVQAPPQLTNTGEIVSNGLVLNIDSSHSASLTPGTSTFRDISGSNTSLTSSGTLTYSNDYSGIMKFTSAGSSKVTFTNAKTMPAWSIETYVRLDANVPTGGNCVIRGQNSGSVMNYVLCFDAGNTIYGGFLNNTGGSGWFYKRSAETLTAGVWYHLAVTYDGGTSASSLQIYVNGTAITLNSVNGHSEDVVMANTDGQQVIIGLHPDVANYTNMSLGYLRMYNRGLSLAEVLQDLNATRTRFASINQNQIYPTKKYGTVLLESATVTSGGDTKTITFDFGDRTGIDWDTVTANTVKLTMQESLTVGTYYDTVTVTDNLGQTSKLPFTIKSTVADTLTVTSGPSLSMVYTGSAPTNGPIARISGLVGIDTATITTQYSGGGAGLTCAQGGSCAIGDIGPGGGYVFYISGTVIDSATGISDGGTYLEVAPKGWNGGTNEYGGQWANTQASVSGTSRLVGTGAENTRKIIAALPSNANLAKVTADLTFGGKSDWFFPSTDEMKAVYNNLYAAGKGDFSGVNYWGSTQDDLNNQTARADTYWFGANNGYSPTDKLGGYYLRPVRAFSPGSITTTTPTDVDTYTVSGTNLTFSFGAASNYAAVVYETSTLVISQANQKKLSINLYGAVAGSSFTLQVSGGSGDGAVTETVTAGGDATNCTLSNRVLSNSNSSTEQRFCRVTVTKAASRNYKVESLTASVYFMVFINDQPTQVGSGSTIGLNGVTSYTVDTTSPPTITTLSATTISIGAGGSFTINGTGFTGNVVVRFYRNKPVTPSSSSSTALTFNVAAIGSAGATTGRITVITDNGQAVSTDTLVINP